MKRTQGSLTIEASISLTLFIMLLLTFLSIGRYATAQNKIKHCVNQAAIEISMRNNMLSEVSSDLENIFGSIGSANGATSLVSKFNSNAANNIAKSGATYSSGQWSNEDLEFEILRFFASNYLNQSFDSLNDRDKILNDLKAEGIYDIEIKGGYNGKFISKTQNGHAEIFFVIEYRIDTNISFHNFFGFSKEPLFSESIKIPLME